METVQQNGRFTLISSKFHSTISSILFDPNLGLTTNISPIIKNNLETNNLWFQFNIAKKYKLKVKLSTIKI